MHCTGENYGRIQEVKHEKSLHALKTLRNNKFYATSKGNCYELEKTLPNKPVENGPVKTPTNKVFLMEWVPSQS
jgi:hypothetical protein